MHLKLEFDSGVGPTCSCSKKLRQSRYEDYLENKDNLEKEEYLKDEGKG